MRGYALVLNRKKARLGQPACYPFESGSWTIFMRIFHDLAERLPVYIGFLSKKWIDSTDYFKLFVQNKPNQGNMIFPWSYGFYTGTIFSSFNYFFIRVGIFNTCTHPCNADPDPLQLWSYHSAITMFSMLGWVSGQGHHLPGPGPLLRCQQAVSCLTRYSSTGIVVNSSRVKISAPGHKKRIRTKRKLVF